MFTTDSANCGIGDSMVYSVRRFGFTCSIYDLIQKLGRTGRRPSASIATNIFTLFINIDDSIYLMIRSCRNFKEVETSAA